MRQRCVIGSRGVNLSPVLAWMLSCTGGRLQSEILNLSPHSLANPLCKAYCHIPHLLLQPWSFWSRAADEARGSYLYGVTRDTGELYPLRGSRYEQDPSERERPSPSATGRPPGCSTVPPLRAEPRQASHLLGSWDQPGGQEQP